jgi:hypothetical protein
VYVLKKELIPKICKEFLNSAWLWWLTPVILTTQEAEIRRIEV